MPNKRTKFKTKHKICFAVRFEVVFARGTEEYLRQSKTEFHRPARSLLLESALSSPFFNPGRATPFDPTINATAYTDYTGSSVNCCLPSNACAAPSLVIFISIEYSSRKNVRTHTH